MKKRTYSVLAFCIAFAIFFNVISVAANDTLSILGVSETSALAQSGILKEKETTTKPPTITPFVLNDDYIVDNFVYKEISPYNVQLSAISNASLLPSDPVIPETITANGKTFQVTSIGAGVFEYSSINSIVLPDSIKSIGNFAFFGCGAMTLTDLPTSLTYIGDFAFSGCSNITISSIPSSVTYIGNNAFDSCINITLTSLPDSLTFIGDYTFYNCANIAFTSLPDSVTYIGEAALASCPNLALTSLPTSLTYIGYYSFSDSPNITITSIPESVSYIGEGAFSNCTNLAISSLPSSITDIKSHTFYGCTNITISSIPNLVHTLDINAFANCTSLAITALPASIKDIPYNPFDGSSVTQLDTTSFEIAKNLNKSGFTGSITVNGVPFTSNSVQNEGDFDYIQTGPTTAEIVGYNGVSFSPVIPSTVNGGALTVTSIGENSFALSSITDITLPNTITSIGNGAFENCVFMNLSSLPPSLTYIGKNAFYNCGSLALTTLPDSITTISNNAFIFCTSLALTELPSSLTYVGQSAFLGCNSLALTDLPDSITQIGDNAFAYCENMPLTSLPANLTTIPTGAFDSCKKLNLTSIPSSVKTIGEYAFSYCENLALTSLPESLVSIENGAFNSCSNLALTSLPSSLTTIEEYVFENCTSLALELLPESLKSVGFMSFTGCTGITQIKIDAKLNSPLNQIFAPEPTYILKDADTINHYVELGQMPFLPDSLNPSISANSLILTLMPAMPRDISIFLGTQPNLASRADISIDNPVVASLSTSSLNSNNHLTVTPLNFGHAFITVTFFDSSNNPMPSHTKIIDVFVTDNVLRTLTLQTDGNGTASANKFSALSGETISLTAVPNSSFQFKEWQIVSGTFSLSSTTNPNASFTMPAESVSVKAVFEALPPNTYAITVQSDGNGTSSANKLSALSGETISLTAIPNSGFQFKEWQIISGTFSLSSTTNPNASFTMPAESVSVKAVFEALPPNTYAITVQSDGNGTSLANKLSALSGETISLTAVPNSGFQFKEWQIISGTFSLSSTTNPNASFTMPAESVSVKAVFEALPSNTYSITVQTDGALTALADKASAKPGETVNLSATISAGNYFNGWSIVSGNITIANKFNLSTSFVMPQENVVIKASSSPISTSNSQNSSRSSSRDFKSSNILDSSSPIKYGSIDFSQNPIIIHVNDKLGYKVPSSIFKEISQKHKDKTVIVKGPVATFTFSPSTINDISDSYNYISFKVTVGYSPFSVQMKNLVSDKNAIPIFFEHHGKLPAKAEISINLGDKYSNQKLNYYYYNEKNSQLELNQSTKSNQNGQISVTQTHCSSYLITGKKASTLSNINQNPSTGL